MTTLAVSGWTSERRTMNGRWTPKMAMRMFCTSIALGLVSSLAAACGSSDGSVPDEGENFQILAVLGTSGLAAQPAAAQLAGVNAAIATINENGGITGRTAELKVVDDQSDPSRAVSLLTAELASAPPDLLFTGSSSAESVAVLPLATRRKVPFVNTNQASDLGNPAIAPYSFSTVATTSAQGTFMADEMKSKGFANIGLLIPNNAVGDASQAAYDSAFKEAGLGLVTERYEAGDIDMSAPISRLDSNEVDAVVFWSAGQASAYILASREKVGLTDVPFYGDAAVSTSDVASVITANQAKNVQFNAYGVSVRGVESEWLPGKKALVEELTAMDVEYTTSLLPYALAYDAVIVAANAFEAMDGQAGDPDAWRKAVEDDPEQKFASAMSDGYGYTAESHFRADFGGYQLVPADASLTDGQYEVSK